MSLKDKIDRSRSVLTSVISLTPNILEKSDNSIRLLFARNADPESSRNVPSLVIEHDKGAGITPEEITDLLFARSVIDDKSISITLADLQIYSQPLQKGELILNNTLVEAAADLSVSTHMYKQAITSRPIHWLDMKENLLDKGFQARDVDAMKADIISLAQSAMLASTNENGVSPIQTTKTLVNHMLTSQGVKNILSVAPFKKTELIIFHSLSNSENKAAISDEPSF